MEESSNGIGGREERSGGRERGGGRVAVAVGGPYVEVREEEQWMCVGRDARQGQQGETQRVRSRWEEERSVE